MTRLKAKTPSKVTRGRILKSRNSTRTYQAISNRQDTCSLGQRFRQYPSKQQFYVRRTISSTNFCMCS